ncbi:hypothetical protein [Levilactobacillus acidifarinae]|uniref:Uncharacterized protein n=1 Tax=Levilactobacillus acidifarinae DSM 19394 = JCM 15949 TaxID=1423715 RepID=A0A0R1LSZ3_9LACO|nr:hypothetical protein [Levilactobacillus acidifarinae]KRK95929.1 hypothetical protein FD25_GL002389 [Levilactobacillus acidifarinae DSM 19394]GEO69232.1 hypothetical protein LAC03_11420 [Levilactobacillus acidifarinae]
MVNWVPAEQGKTLGQLGTENGIILKDEVWPGVGRITLEQKRSESTITCGLYGSFVHTAFTDEAHEYSLYNTMKAALEESPDELEELEVWIDEFVHRFS